MALTLQILIVINKISNINEWFIIIPKLVDEFCKLNILLINPLKAVSTKQIFEMGFKNYSDEIAIEKDKLSDANYLINFLKKIDKIVLLIIRMCLSLL